MLQDAGRRRMAVTLLCLIVSSTIFTSFFIFIDSYSQDGWDYETDVGPASMVIVGSEGLEFSEEILALPHITKVSSLKISVASVVAYEPGHNVTLTLPPSIPPGTFAQPDEDELNVTIRVGCIDETFQESFPSIINVTDGKLPESNIEIAFSEWVANLFKVTVGDIVSYEHGVVSPHYSFLRLVGVYAKDEADVRSGHYYALADAVIPPALMTNDSREDYLFLEVDRSNCQPFMPSIGVAFLSEVEENIRGIDPQYAYNHQTSFYIDDILAKGIVRYQAWFMDMKLEQLTRIQGFIFFAFVLAGFGVRYNIKHKKSEIEVLRARGASGIQITMASLRELIVLGSLSTGFALGLGFLMSRIGLTTSGFFQFGQLRNGPFLLTFDSIILLIIPIMVLPVSLYSIFHNNSKIVTTSSIGNRGFTRLTRLIKLLRWDISLSLVSLVILLTAWESGSLVAQNPIFALLVYGAPFTFFIGIAGLISRSLRTSSNWLSSILRKPLGKLATGLGIRRISWNSSTSGATVLVIALSLSLAWNGAIIDVTFPNTILNHTRFAIGSDIAFRLEEDSRDSWNDLLGNVAESPLVEGLSTVTTYGLSLSSDIQDLVEFVAIDPLLYASVGYDSLGYPLAQSNLMPSLTALDQNPTGIIMTSDVARAYGLSEGDTLRAFRANGSEIETLIFNTLAVVESLPDSMVGPNGYTPPPSTSSISVGRGRIWIHIAHAGTIFSQDSSLITVLCVRTREGTNGQELVDEILGSDVADAILGNAIASVIADESSHQDLFILDRTIDTFLIIVALSSIPVAFFVHFYEQLEDKRKESALLRAIGMEPMQLHKYQVIETQSVILYSILLIVVGAPILVTNSLNVIVYTSTIAFKAFPSPILLSIPWIPIFLLITYLILCAGAVGLILSVLNAKHPIHKVTRETWADSRHNRGQTE